MQLPPTLQSLFSIHLGCGYAQNEKFVIGMPTVRAEDCHAEYNVAPKLQQLIVYCHVECFAEHLPLATI